MYPDQYPDKLVREDGTEHNCRFYPNNRSTGIKKVVDGAEVDAKYTIALPESTPLLLIGESITGYDRNGEVIVWQDTVALYHRGLLHCVAYV